MVDVKQAIAKAKAYAADMIGTSELLLEEVHSVDDRFEITLSFPVRGPFDVPTFRGGMLQREYKKFEIDKQSGELLGMSIRQIE